MHLHPGAYSYTSGTTLTVSAPVVFDADAVLTCSGANVAFSSTVQAPRSKIFASGCTPSLAGSPQQTAAFPEWWGGKGDATSVVGVGTDNTTAITSALNSGAKQISFAPNGNYRFTSISCSCSLVEITGASRDTTFLMQDDPTGRADAFTFTGGNRITLHNLAIARLQNATGFLSSAYVISGGSGYAVNDTITLAGGTSTTAAVLKVTSVSSGAVTGVSVQTAGSYSAPPKPTQTLTSTPAVAQASTSGAGTGATFKLLMDGPAIVRLKDGYWVRIEDNVIAQNWWATSWDGITIEGVSTGNSEIYISRNQIKSGADVGVKLWGPSTSANVNDTFIDNHNYIRDWGYAGVLGYGCLSFFVTDNVMYNDNYGVYFDSLGLPSGGKVRANDLDTDLAGQALIGMGTTHFQNNWVGSGGPVVFTGGNGIVGGGNQFNTLTGSVWFNGVVGATFPNELFTNFSNPIQLGVYGGAATTNAVFGGNVYYGGGSFVTASGSPSPSSITVSGQLASSFSGLYSGSGTNINLIGALTTSTNVSQPNSRELWGSNSTVSGTLSASGGYGNAVSGYASVGLGQYNNVTGAYSSARGVAAADDGLYGADCFASGQPVTGVTGISGAGWGMACTHLLYGESTSTSPVRLTSDQNAAGAANCINLGAYNHMLFDIKVSAYQQGTFEYADWVSANANSLTTGATTTGSGIGYSGDFSTAAAPTHANGLGAATLQVSADTTNGCLNVTVTPANATETEYVAVIRRLKVR